MGEVLGSQIDSSVLRRDPEPVAVEDANVCGVDVGISRVGRCDDPIRLPDRPEPLDRTDQVGERKRSATGEEAVDAPGGVD